ncbi:hypothetical protein CR513_47222, partial [Mucuna pruriens]
ITGYSNSVRGGNKYHLPPELESFLGAASRYLGFRKMITLLGPMIGSRRVVSACLNNFDKNWLKKSLFLLVTIEAGKPCNLTTLEMNILVTSLVEKGCDKLMKCTYFVNLSTTIKIVSFLRVLESSKMKSIDMPLQTWVGIGRGCRSLASAKPNKNSSNSFKSVKHPNVIPIGDILEKFKMESSKLISMPIEEKLKLTKESEGKKGGYKKYKSLIRSLRYLIVTRPYIVLGLIYLVDTLIDEILYANNNNVKLIGYTDMIHQKQNTPTKIFCDNKSTIALSKNLQSKHIDIRFHKIQELITQNKVKINYC